MKKKLLIADDSAILQNFLKKNIKEDYELEKAQNGDEAINILANNPVEVLILDLNMPKTNGFKVLEYLKSNELFAQISVIVITGDDTEKTNQKLLSYPIKATLYKPFTKKKIIQILDHVKNT